MNFNFMSDWPAYVFICIFIGFVAYVIIKGNSGGDVLSKGVSPKDVLSKDVKDVSSKIEDKK